MSSELIRRQLNISLNINTDLNIDRKAIFLANYNKIITSQCEDQNLLNSTSHYDCSTSESQGYAKIAQKLH